MDGRLQLHICRDCNHQYVRRHSTIEDRERPSQALCQLTLRCDRAALTPLSMQRCFLRVYATGGPFTT
jgi:hypothetical protein